MIKRASLGQYFKWNGQITQVEWLNLGQKSIGFKTKEKVECPHCGLKHEIVVGHDEIESSPNFQQGAELMPTLDAV